MGTVEHELRLARWRLHPRAALLAAATAERVAYGGVFVLALVLRLLDLADKPFHHDESLHATFSWQLANGAHFLYDPVYHGPVQQYVGATMYFFGGVSDFVIRLGPALVGTVLVVLPYFLRRQLGTAGALAASVILAISPSYLYFSRFVREDIYTACITLGLIVLTFRFLDRPRRWHPAAILGLLAVSFATKETTYITVFIGGTFFVAVAARELWQARARGIETRTAPFIGAVRSVGLNAWIWAASAFAFVFTVLFTFFLLEPQGLRAGLYDAISYWLSQHGVHRGGQPWFYYLVLMPLYELPVLLVAAVGIFVALRQRTLFRAFLVWDAVLSVAIYSWAGERMPWLVLHPLLPLVLLAGVGFQLLWEQRSRIVRVAALAFAAAGAAVLLYGAVEVSYVHPADPAELLVFTQTSADVTGIRAEIAAIDRRLQRTSGRRANVYVDGTGGADWPWGWYLRDLPWVVVDPAHPESVKSADALLFVDLDGAPTRKSLLPVLRDYRVRKFRLREWWIFNQSGASPGDVWRWFVTREPWSDRGALWAWLYVPTKRPSAAEAPSEAARG
ncbi:MAG: TIGR03663 family protein [Actinomycetota bacterium]|nr:TIGR03663 family protein [Actinomycetota bacterium]